MFHETLWVYVMCPDVLPSVPFFSTKNAACNPQADCITYKWGLTYTPKNRTRQHLWT